jgi:4-hydroxy-tetrahydrodipicolinate reductase
MATDIIINGALGKMGKEILLCALEDRNMRITGCLEYPAHPSIGKDIGPLIGREPVNVLLSDSVGKSPFESSVIIDFSVPAATSLLLQKLSGKHTALVIATTGFDKNGVAAIEDFSRSNPVVFSPNMSLGVNILFYLTELVASKLNEDFDIEIIEAHHRFKKDAPSGTAKKLGEIAAASLGLSYDQAIKNGRAGIVGERTRKEVGMHAVRGGDIVGDHTVLFAGLGERIELKHVIHSRSTLARGAITAAKWISNRKSGLYSMRDVLGF